MHHLIQFLQQTREAGIAVPIVQMRKMRFGEIKQAVWRSQSKCRAQTEFMSAWCQAQAVMPPLSHLDPRPAASHRHRAQRKEWDSVSLRSAWRAVCPGSSAVLRDTRGPSLPVGSFPLSFPEPLGCRRPRAPRVILEPASHPLQALQALRNKQACVCVGSRMEDEPFSGSHCSSILLRVMLWVSVIHM